MARAVGDVTTEALSLSRLSTAWQPLGGWTRHSITELASGRSPQRLNAK